MSPTLDGICTVSQNVSSGLTVSIVGKTYQTFNSLPPCQEIVISRHKLSQNDNFVSKYPSSAAAILKLRFRDHVTPIF